MCRSLEVDKRLNAHPPRAALDGVKLTKLCLKEDSLAFFSVSKNKSFIEKCLPFFHLRVFTDGSSSCVIEADSGVTVVNEMLRCDHPSIFVQQQGFGLPQLVFVYFLEINTKNAYFKYTLCIRQDFQLNKINRIPLQLV